MISALKKKKKNREENPVDAVKKESERVIVRATFGIGVAALCLSARHVPSVAAVWSSRPLLRRSTIGGRHTRVVFPWLLYLAHTVNASHTPARPPAASAGMSRAQSVMGRRGACQAPSRRWRASRARRPRSLIVATGFEGAGSDSEACGGSLGSHEL